MTNITTCDRLQLAAAEAARTIMGLEVGVDLDDAWDRVNAWLAEQGPIDNLYRTKPNHPSPEWDGVEVTLMSSTSEVLTLRWRGRGDRAEVIATDGDLSVSAWAKAPTLCGMLEALD